jgi:hypothetical protein
MPSINQLYKVLKDRDIYKNQLLAPIRDFLQKPDSVDQFNFEQSLERIPEHILDGFIVTGESPTRIGRAVLASIQELNPKSHHHHVEGLIYDEHVRSDYLNDDFLSYVANDCNCACTVKGGN